MDAIQRFKGAVILVTHNEMFLHALANRLLIFQSNGISLFEGGYTDFLERVGWEDETDGSESRLSQSGHTKTVNKKDMRKRRADILARKSRDITPLKKKIGEIEKKIATGEARSGQLNMELVEASEVGDGRRIARLSREFSEVQTEIERLYEDLDTCSRKLDDKEKEYDRQVAELEQ
jgi:ATP-binding cassette subfamily F protein 3